MSTLSGKPLKSIYQFPYLGSKISSIESDIIHLVNEWNAIYELLIIWKSDLSGKVKQYFFQAVAVSILLYGCTPWTLTKRTEKNLDGNYTRMLCAFLNEAAPHKAVTVRPLNFHLTNYSSKTNKTCRVGVGAGMNSEATFYYGWASFCRPLMFIGVSFVRTQDPV